MTETILHKPKLWSLNFFNVSVANFLMSCSFDLLTPAIPLYITQYMGVPQSQTGIVLASYAIALIFVRPLSGFLVDKYSRKSMLLIGLLCYILVYFGYFWATTILLFILVRFIHGLTWGLSTVSVSTLAVDIIPLQRRAEGIGLYSTAQYVATAIGPYIAIHIYQAYSFQHLIWCAVCMGTIGMIVAALIQAPAVPKRSSTSSRRFYINKFFLVRGLPIFLNQMLYTFAWGTIGPYVVQYGLTMKIHNPGIFFLFWAGGIILSRTFSGRLVDKGYLHKVIGGSLVIITCVFFVFAVVHNVYIFCISGLFIGIGFGALSPALQMLYLNLAPDSQRGAANSTYYLAFDLGLALGMLSGGYITGYFSFESLYLVAAGFSFVATLVYIFSSIRIYEKRRLR